MCDSLLFYFLLFFFFQAEDGIRDDLVTGVQTCALPICYLVNVSFSSSRPDLAMKVANTAADAYIVAEMDGKYQNLRQASDWLQERYHTQIGRASCRERV